MSQELGSPTDIIMEPHGHAYVNVKCKGWTDSEAAAASQIAKVGKSKSRGGSKEEHQKAVLQTLVFSIPEMAQYNFCQFSSDNKTALQIGSALDLLHEGVQRATSLQKEWRLLDMLPQDYCCTKKVWSHMDHFGAKSRAQLVGILSVLKALRKKLYVELGKLDAEEQSFSSTMVVSGRFRRP